MQQPDIKQVILVRNDLKMSPGKAAAQVGHAGLLFLADTIYRQHDQNADHIHFSIRELKWLFANGPIPGPTTVDAHASVAFGGMKKIVLGVEDIDELWALHWAAKDAGIKAFNVFDEGLNAITCCAIGPDFAETIDPITRRLNLYGPPERIVEHFQPTRELYGSDLVNDKELWPYGRFAKPIELHFTEDTDHPIGKAFAEWDDAIRASYSRPIDTSWVRRPRKHRT